MKRLLCAVVYVLALFGGNSLALAQSPTEINAVRQFTQRFYDWYVPIANGEGSTPSDVVAIRSKREDFTEPLRKALAADEAAQAKAKEIVGLDFDPFLNSQDPDKQYKVGKVTSRGGKVFEVEVFGVENGKLASKPSVTAEVIKENGKFRFANFHFGNGGSDDNLRSLLKSLAAERRKH